MTLQVVKWSYDFMQASSSMYVTNHPAKFDGRSQCCSEDMAYLACQVTLQGHVIKEPFDFAKESILLYLTTLPGLVVIGIVEVEICFYFITWQHVIVCSKMVVWLSRWKLLLLIHHIMKWPCNFMRGSSSSYIPKFHSHWHCDSG